MKTPIKMHVLFTGLIALSCVGSVMGYTRTAYNNSNRPIKVQWHLAGAGWTGWQLISPGTRSSMGKQSKGAWLLKGVKFKMPRSCKKVTKGWDWSNPITGHHDARRGRRMKMGSAGDYSVVISKDGIKKGTVALLPSLKKGETCPLVDIEALYQDHIGGGVAKLDFCSQHPANPVCK